MFHGGGHGGGEPPLAVLSNLLLFLLICGMAGSCDARLFMQQIKKPKGIAAALFSQFVVLPAVGFTSMMLLPQPAVTVVTLLIVTTSPGGGFSGWWCSLCNADLALSVAMTTASTFACLVALPFNIWLYVTLVYGRSVVLDWGVLLTAVVNVVIAVGFGLWIGARMPARRGTINAIGQAAGVLLMVLGFFASSASHDPIWDNPPSWFVAVCSPCLIGLVIALLLARSIGLPPPEATAVAIECCYQNTGLGLTIALSAFPPEDTGKAAGVPLVYGVAEIAVIGTFALLASRLGWTHAPKDEPLLKALAGNYQPSAPTDARAMQLT
tara:strand:- start:124 stop:1095 length:972 start_codon:yes stop_codon:yes gene_type:complete